jgi:hypothetical protein
MELLINFLILKARVISELKWAETSYTDINNFDNSKL